MIKYTREKFLNDEKLCQLFNKIRAAYVPHIEIKKQLAKWSELGLGVMATQYARVPGPPAQFVCVEVENWLENISEIEGDPQYTAVFKIVSITVFDNIQEYERSRAAYRQKNGPGLNVVDQN